MSFVRSEMAFNPGLFANRSRRASKLRWVDGNLVRFRDGVPAQVGGWVNTNPNGVAVTGVPRAMIAWRPNSQAERWAAIGTDQGVYRYDGDRIDNISPAGFVPGSSTSAIGTGYGVGRYNEGLYGTPRPPVGNIIDAAGWTFDLFGQVLLACYTYSGVIYNYDPAGGGTVLTVVSGAPSAAAIVVSDERHLFAFGSGGDPGYVRWSDRENYSVWTPSSTNRAGGYQLQVRSPFQCGARVRGQVLGITKTEVFAFAPLQNALVYSRDRVSTEAGVIGPHAIAVVTDSSGETAYWMGPNDFYAYDGLVRTLNCELRDYVFNDINLVQGAKSRAGINTQFNEVAFFYPSAASIEVDRGVAYNYADGTWTKLSIARSAWLDAGVFSKPLALTPTGTLFKHETGVTADGAPMPSFVVSHPITLGVGERFADVDQWWPDMQDGSASAKVSFICRDGPSLPPRTEGPYVFQIGDEFVPLSFSAREMQLRIDGNGGAWELGLPQISMQGGSLR